jgi:hypothetical protein
MTALRQRMIEDMQLRNLGSETQRATYITSVAWRDSIKPAPNTWVWKRFVNTSIT